MLSWVRPGLPSLSILLVPFSTLGLLLSVRGRVRLQLICVPGVGFVVGHFLTCLVRCSSFTLAMFGREMRRCSGVRWLVAVWNGFLLTGVKGQPVPCRFCGGADGDGHLFLGVHLLKSVKILSFMIS